jgi:hypothetical protein
LLNEVDKKEKNTMTTRQEEVRSLEMTRQFLIALLKSNLTPKEIRAKAAACLRHYPLDVTQQERK